MIDESFNEIEVSLNVIWFSHTRDFPVKLSLKIYHFHDFLVLEKNYIYCEHFIITSWID